MRRYALPVASVFLALVAAVHLLGFPILNAGERLLHPLGRMMSATGTRLHSAGSELTQLGSLRRTVRDNEREITSLRQRLIGYERIVEQNRQLEEELGYVRRSEHEFIATDIINYQPDSTREMMRIGAGSDDGIEPGLPVVSRGALIGITGDVGSRSSSVVLVSDLDFRALVLIGDASGVLRGQVGGSLIVERIPRNQGVSEGDLVITSGQDGVYPAGLLVGTIQQVTQASGEVFDTARVKAEVSPRRLHTVLVMRR